MQERRLLVGLDLCDDYSQISRYNDKTFEPDCLGPDDREESQYVPTLMAVKKDTREWLFGKEAFLCLEEGKGERVDGLLKKVEKKEPFVLWGREVSPVKALSRFLSKMLTILKIHHPNETIAKLVVTVENTDMGLMEAIYQSLEELGIHRDRALVMGHRQSYSYYVLCQKKELWLTDVGMFEFDEKGLKYRQLIIDRGRKPMMVGISEKDYSETFSLNTLGRLDEDREGVSYLFENLVKSAIHNQIISTLYMIGKGFDGDWSDPLLQKLCVGRRVFKGKNLYVKGACYAARETSGNGRLEEFIFLDEEMLPCHVSANMYVEGKEREVVLVKAGTPWYQVQSETDFIPDEEEELQLMVRNVITKEVVKHLIPLEMAGDRPRRMTRFQLRLRFEDKRTLIVAIKDRGFGDAYQTTNRIWERTIPC